MNKVLQRKFDAHRSSRAPVPTPIDDLIEQNQGSSVALEATRARMEASKRKLTPTPFQRIEQLTRENAALRGELDRFYRVQSANGYFIKETKDALDRLQQAVFEWRKAQKDIDSEFKKESSGYSRETESIRVGIRGSQ